MACLSEETLHEFACGELGDAEEREVFKHVRGCAVCRDAVRASLRVYQGLMDMNEPGPCPDLETLEAYHGNELAPEGHHHVYVHAQQCEHCRDILALLSASPEVLAAWAREENRTWRPA